MWKATSAVDLGQGAEATLHVSALLTHYKHKLWWLISHLPMGSHESYQAYSDPASQGWGWRPTHYISPSPHHHELGFGALPIASQSVFVPQSTKGRCWVAADVGGWLCLRTVDHP